jgi:AraC family transcriptional regulator
MENQYYNQRINCVIDYIEENLETKFSLDDLAGVAKFSKYHFHRIFKAITGETLNDYKKRIKMEKSCRQVLIHKKKSLTKIAFEMGYNSSANFSRDFYNYYNLSPSKVRTTEKHPLTREIFTGSNLNLSFKGIENIPDQQTIYDRVTSGYDPKTIGKAFMELYNYFQEKHFNLSVEQMIGIGYDDPDYTPPEKCRYDACVVVNGNIDNLDIFPYNKKVLKGGKYAVFLFEGRSEQFFPAWDIIFREWVVTSQYVPDNRPHLEMYLPYEHYKNGLFKAYLCLPVEKIPYTF